MILAKRDRLSIGGERKAANAQFVSGCAGLRFRQSDAGDLRPAIGAAWNFLALRGMRLQSLDGFDANDAFMLRLVGQHRRARHIADRVNAWDVGPSKSIRFDAIALQPDAEGLEAEALNIALNADRYDEFSRRKFPPSDRPA